MKPVTRISPLGAQSAKRRLLAHQPNGPKPPRLGVGSDAYADDASCVGGAARRTVFFLGFSTARASTGERALSALAVFFWTGGLRARSCHLVWSETTAFSADMSMTRTSRVRAPGAADEAGSAIS